MALSQHVKDQVMSAVAENPSFAQIRICVMNETPGIAASFLPTETMGAVSDPVKAEAQRTMAWVKQHLNLRLHDVHAIGSSLSTPPAGHRKIPVKMLTRHVPVTTLPMGGDRES